MGRPFYRFGDYRIDPSTRELSNAGELVPLSPKVFDCIAYLIEQRERAVGRDELIAAVWGKADVSDTLLSQTVLKARRAVGDAGNEQNAIRTIPRFGYRWVAPLRVEDVGDVEAGTADAPAAERLEPEADPTVAVVAALSPSAPTSAPARPTARRRVAYALALAALVTTVLAYAVFARRGTTIPHAQVVATPTADIAADALAVLPVDIADAGDASWLRLGLMDLIATRLRSGGQPVVPSDNVVAILRGEAHAQTPVQRVRRGAGARFVVEPAAARIGDAWRVRLALDEDGGARREVEAEAADALAAGRAAADRLLALLGKRAAATAEETRDLPAGDVLARAESLLLTDDLDAARRLLESAPPALQQSPELRLRLAQIDFRAGRLDATRAQLDTLLGETSAEADPVLRARVLNASGVTYIRRERDAEGERAFSEAIALLDGRNQPAALGQAYTGRAVAYSMQGRFDLAQADFARARVALELAGDALALARVEANEGILSAKRGHYADALAAHERAATRFERFGALNELASTLANAAGAQLALLRATDALATTDRAWPLTGRLENRRTPHNIQVERATALGANGRTTEARALLTALAKEIAADGDTPMLARVHLEQAREDVEAGHYDSAAALAADAVAALQPDDDYRRERATAWLCLTRALRAAGRDTDAATEVGRFEEWSRGVDTIPVPAYAQLARAEQLWAERKREASQAAYADALARAAAIDVPADTAEIAVSYATSLIADGEAARASGVVGQVARWAERDYACALLQLRHYRALGERAAWQAAVVRARGLAGERRIPAALLSMPPADDRAAKNILSQNQ